MRLCSMTSRWWAAWLYRGTQASSIPLTGCTNSGGKPRGLNWNYCRPTLKQLGPLCFYFFLCCTILKWSFYCRWYKGKRQTDNMKLSLFIRTCFCLVQFTRIFALKFHLTFQMIMILGFVLVPATGSVDLNRLLSLADSCSLISFMMWFLAPV